MLPSPLPSWMRHRIVEVIAAYRTTILLCEERCEELEAAGALGDDYGTLGEYRMDAKYCAGTATRIPLLILDYLTDGEVAAIATILRAELPATPLDPEAYRRTLADLDSLELHQGSRYKEVAVDPQKLAGWAWRKPLKPPEPTPEPDQAVPEHRLSELLQPLSQREAEALILTKVCLLPAEQVAEIMKCSVDQVNMAVYRGKKRLKEQADNAR